MKKLIIIFIVIVLSINAFGLTVSAESENLSAIISGDADGNGTVTPGDARMILRAAAGIEYIYLLENENCDVDGNGVVTVSDARATLIIACGLDSVHNKPSENVPETPLEEKVISIKTICQYPDYPSGCEAVATVMALNYYGFGISVSDFINGYLSLGTAPYKIGEQWYSSDPNSEFLGNPSSNSGWGIWANGIKISLNKYFYAVKSGKTAQCIYNESLDDLCVDYIAKDDPVLLWVTAGMKSPYENITAHVINSDEMFTWISPNHCMLLVGYDENNYIFNDPISGVTEKYAKSIVDIAYKGNGSQAVIIK